MVSVLDSLKADIGKSEIATESLQHQKEEFEEEKKELAENLKSTTKNVKKKKEVAAELAKLSGQDMRVLQAEVGAINNELEELKE